MSVSERATSAHTEMSYVQPWNPALHEEAARCPFLNREQVFFASLFVINSGNIFTGSGR